jgi:hypothetical protein
MSQPNSREVVLLAEAARTTNGTGSTIIIPSMYRAAILHVNVPTVSGTSPTLVCYVQNALTPAASTDLIGAPPTGTQFYQDLLAFTTATTSGQKVLAWLQGGSNNTSVLNQDATLTVGAINNGPIGGAWRVKFVVGGTSPSFAFSVSALLIPE